MSDALRQRQQLLKIGTARAGRAPPALAAPLDTLLAPAQAEHPEAALWLSIGALDLVERSGFLPPESPAATPLQAAAPEHLAPCPPRAETVFALLLRGAHPAGLQQEWLGLLQRHGSRLPARFLPVLLDAATRQPALREDVLPVLGERGRWLARLQPAWSWAAHAAADADAAWDTGTPEQRIAALAAWRTRDPQAALALLAAAWPQEAPDQRAALLAVLATGLGPADEAFLEAGLDDRRKEVRAAAQSLLVRLPGSALGGRMLARLLPLLRVDTSALPARIELALPAACDAAMRRDGIGAGPHPGLGEKAGWVSDMLAAVDPAAWTRHFGCAPRACLALAEHGEFAGALVRGWSLAALRHPHTATADWPRELVLWWIGAKPALRKSVPDALLDCVAARFHDDGEAVLAAFTPDWAHDGGMVELLHRLIDKSAATWTPALTRRVLQLLLAARPVLAAPGQHWLARMLLPALARVADPAAGLAFEAAWRADAPADDPWRSPADHFFDLVRLRHEMSISFQESA